MQSLKGYKTMYRATLILAMLFCSGMSTCYAQQWHVFTTSNSGLPNNKVGSNELLSQQRSVVIDQSNNAWMLSGDFPIPRLEKFNTVTNELETFKITDDPFSSNGTGFFTIYCDSRNIVWASTYHDITGEYKSYGYNGVEWSPAFSGGGWDFGEDHEGNFWTTGGQDIDDAILKYDGQTITEKSFMINGWRAPGPNILLYDIDFDLDNNFWCAYWQLNGPSHSGLVKYRDGFLPVVYATTNFLSALEIQKDDDVWVGTTFFPLSFTNFDPAAGIARLNGAGWDRYSTANSALPNDTIYALNSDKVGRLWIATAHGVARFNEVNEWKIFTMQNSPLLSNIVTGITIDTVGNKWLSTFNGLVRFNEITPAFSHQNLCFGTVEFQDQSASMEGNIQAWHWDFAGLGTSAKPDPSFSFPTPGEYNVRLWMKDEIGNRNMITQKITITAETPDLNLGVDIQTCLASAVIGSDFNSASQYTWHTPSGITQGGTTLTATRSGEYILEAKMPDGCALKDTVNVIVNELNSTRFSVTSAGRDLNTGDVILKGIPIQCTPVNPAQQALTWSFGDNTISPEEAPVHTYEHAGTYTITLTSATNSDCGEKKIIEVQDIFITTAISPNGDGKNDKLYIEPFIYETSLKVIDQRGRTVYDAPSYHDDFTGEDLAEGIYYYELHFKEVDKGYKGYVQIIK
jgi:PKD repeat protein